jgi:deoxyribonuclease V
VLDGERVGYWVRTKHGTRPLAAHAAWRTGPEIAVEVLLTATDTVRAPEPLRRARAAARRLRGQQALRTA